MPQEFAFVPVGLLRAFEQGSLEAFVETSEVVHSIARRRRLWDGGVEDDYVLESRRIGEFRGGTSFVALCNRLLGRLRRVPMVQEQSDGDRQMQKGDWILCDVDGLYRFSLDDWDPPSHKVLSRLLCHACTFPIWIHHRCPGACNEEQHQCDRLDLTTCHTSQWFDLAAISPAVYA